MTKQERIDEFNEKWSNLCLRFCTIADVVMGDYVYIHAFEIDTYLQYLTEAKQIMEMEDDE